MKATKLIAIVAFAGLTLSAQSLLAQSDDGTEVAPKVDEYGYPIDDPEVDANAETVTIDTASEDSESSFEDESAAQPERKEKLRVYSGKHDGNNVIKDPR